MSYVMRFRKAWPFIQPVIGVGTFLTYIGVTFADATAQLVSIVDFVASPNSLILVVSLLFFYFVYVHIKHRNVPLTVTDCTVDVIFNTPSGDKVTIKRVQKIRANHDDITGYFRNMSGPEASSIEAEDGNCHIDHCDPGDQSFKAESGSRGEWRLIHRFAPIPRKLRYLGLNTVTREEKIVLRNAFMDQEEFYDVKIPEVYPHKKILLNIHFHADRPPIASTCRAIRINRNGIEDLMLKPIIGSSHGSSGTQLLIRGKPNETYRIDWTFSEETTQKEGPTQR